MNLDNIKTRIAELPSGKDFTVNSKNLASLNMAETLLRDSFGVRELGITGLSKQADNTAFSGKTGAITFLGANFQSADITFSFSEANNFLIMEAGITLPGELNPFTGISGAFSITGLAFSSTINEYLQKTAGHISANINIDSGKLSLPVEVSFMYASSHWSIAAKAASGNDHTVSIADIVTLLGVEKQENLLPQKVVDIINSLSITGLRIGFDNEQKTIESFEIGLAITHDKPWDLMDGLSLGDLKLELSVDRRWQPDAENAPDSPDVDVTVNFFAAVEVLNTTVPILVIYSGRDSTFSASIKQKLKLGSLDDLIKFTGQAKIADLVPQDYAVGELYLESLFLQLGVQGLDSFSVEIGMEHPLDIMGVFSVEDINVAYSMYTDTTQAADGQKNYQVALMGSFTLGSLPFGVEAAKQSNGSWIISAYTRGPDEILMADLLAALPNKMFPSDIPLPKIGLGSIRLNYTGGENRFTFDAFAFVNADYDNYIKFEYLNATFALECKKENNSWNISGAIKGNVSVFSCVFSIDLQFGKDKSTMTLALIDDPKTFNLINFCRALGLTDFNLPDGINLSLKDLNLSYDFKTGELEFTAENGDGGKLYFQSKLVEKERRYVFGMEIKFDLGLGGLPLAGAAGGLDKVHIKDLKIIALNYNDDALVIPDILTKTKFDKGLYLGSSLTLPDKVMPLLLPLQGSAQKTTRADAAGSGVVININKNIGPFAFKKLHIAYTGGRLSFGLDASFTESALTFALDGLGMACDIKGGDPSFNLSGLSVDVNTGSVSIGGSFLRVDDTTYTGELLLQMGDYALTAIGSYTAKPVKSVFVFALLKANLGGPPCFFITGVAAGFGYNRNLTVPDINGIEDYPLIKAVQGRIPESDITDPEKTPFKPQLDSNWFAAGILFNSFKMINSTAILTLLIARDTEINLLGRSVLQIPFDSSAKQESTPVAYAVLLLKVSFKPASGLVSAEAALSSESYVLSKSCRLTGGFAFYSWYSGPHTGDFVVTLGGYNSIYKKPAHYPDVRRLGLSWQITGDLSAQGSLYFALTPSCVMAGGSLTLNFAIPHVKAWFDMRLDVFIRWKPYFYDFYADISLGVKVNLWICSLTLELGCNLHIWGPEFAGNARVKLWCISFTINLGSDAQSSRSDLSPDEFIASFLPQGGDVKKSPSGSDGAYQGCTVQFREGLLKERKTGAGQTKTVCCADRLKIVTGSLVPSTSLQFNGTAVDTVIDGLFIRPCGIALGNSIQKVSLKKDGVTVTSGQISVESIRQKMPAALWAPPDYNDETIDTYTGILIALKSADYYSISFGDIVDEIPIPFTVQMPPQLPSSKYIQDQAYAEIRKTAGGDADRNRKTLLESLGESSCSIDLSRTAASPESVFCVSPALVSIGGEL
ncbi:MAG: hypothetical protein LBT16_02950 [Treponema sp.]|nr:hypothetical protein [Treponema sp.]